MYSATVGAVAAIQALSGYETVGLSLAGLACRRPPRVWVGLVASDTPLQLGGTGVVSPLEYPCLLRQISPKTWMVYRWVEVLKKNVVYYSRRVL